MLEGVTNKMKEWFEANKEKATKTLKVSLQTFFHQL